MRRALAEPVAPGETRFRFSDERMKPERLQELLDQFPKRRVAVLGDFFLDKYLEVDPALAEPSLETGRTAHQVVRVRRSPGAAGTVVNNLAALGTGNLYAIGAIGDDGEGYDLQQGLQQLGCNTKSLLLCHALVTPTYLKPRDKGVPGLPGEHSRYDIKNRCPTPPEITARVIASIEKLLPRVDALVIMDQVESSDCGVITTEVRAVLAEKAHKYRRVVFWADSRRHIKQFRHIITKPNQFEAVGRTNPLPGDELSLTDLKAAITRLRAETQAPVCITCAEHGMLVSDPQVTLVPTVHLTGPLDPTGAGDSATAGTVLALAAGATLPEAALIGNLVASITVQQLATTGTATPDQVLQRLGMWREQHEKRATL